MHGEFNSIAASVVAAGLFLWRGLAGLVGQAGDAGSGIDLPTTIGLGGGLGAFVFAVQQSLNRWFEHREAMANSGLQDQLDTFKNALQAEIDARKRTEAAQRQAAEERERMKLLLSAVIPVLQEDRMWMVRANAMFPDELPLPDGFGSREFDHQLGTLFSLGASTTPRQVKDMIEGREPLGGLSADLPVSPPAGGGG